VFHAFNLAFILIFADLDLRLIQHWINCEWLFYIIIAVCLCLLAVTALEQKLFTAYEKTVGTVLRGSLAVGRCTCDLQVADSIPGRPLSRNIDQLSLASLRGR